MRREAVDHMETSNTFPIPEVIFDPSLVLSPHVTLLCLLLADGAFAAPTYAVDRTGSACLRRSRRSRVRASDRYGAGNALGMFLKSGSREP